MLGLLRVVFTLVCLEAQSMQLNAEDAREKAFGWGRLGHAFSGGIHGPQLMPATESCGSMCAREAHERPLLAAVVGSSSLATFIAAAPHNGNRHLA